MEFLEEEKSIETKILPVENAVSHPGQIKIRGGS